MIFFCWTNWASQFPHDNQHESPISIAGLVYAFSVPKHCVPSVEICHVLSGLRATVPKERVPSAGLFEPSKGDNKVQGVRCAGDSFGA
jgi:hypothetical protein